MGTVREKYTKHTHVDSTFTVQYVWTELFRYWVLLSKLVC